MINRDKLEHILEYARQQRHIGQCCKVPPEDMVEIMERLLNSGNSLVIPDEMTSEQAYEIGYYYGDPVNVFARGANWMRQHIIDSTLAAAPQSPGSDPATVPGKWIPVSEQKPDCWCLTCRPVTLNDMRFVVCPDCGNKRCPRANDHRNACTGSNEPGQEGSAYPDTPREVK